MVIRDVLTLHAVRALAGEKFFARGMAYFHSGAVGLLLAQGEAVSAEVKGTRRYRVRLAVAGDRLGYTCTCPVGQDGDFCKHAVAVALSWLENEGEECFPPNEAELAKPRKKRKRQADTLAEYFSTLDETALRELLLEACANDKGLRDRYLMQARAVEGGDKGLRSAVMNAVRQSSFLDWREVGAFAMRIDAAAALIEQRLPRADAALVQLIEDTMAEGEKSLENVDDSDGEVQDALCRLGEVHLAACLAARPDPAELADRLFERECAAQWDFFAPALPHYAPALGEAGRARYAQLVRDAAEALPELSGKTRGFHYDARRSYVESALRKLCEDSGDFEPLIRLYRKDLNGAHEYARLVGLYAGLERLEDAFAVFEAALAIHPDDGRLSELGIELCRRTQRHARAAELAWAQFMRRPDFGAYQKLLEHACDAAERGAWRERALMHLESAMTAPSQGSDGFRHALYARGTLIEIRLEEGEAETAWSLAQGHSLPDRLWPRLAACRGETHPDEAIALYWKLLPGAVARGQGNARYEEAYDYVRAIRALHQHQNRLADFSDKLAALRLNYKAKRNFIKLLAMLD